jgi:PTH1 family peptidyl-tRNA hydrolase
MLIILGLGNPHRYYNRHNAGHRLIDTLIPRSALAHITLLKTTSMMNNSSRCARNATRSYTGPLWVAYDDLETPLGEVKWKWGGSAAGHNGIRDINAHYTTDYGRIRIGIGRPLDNTPISNYVLTDHAPSELAILDKVNTQIAKFLEEHSALLLTEDIETVRKIYAKHTTKHTVQL